MTIFVPFLAASIASLKSAYLVCSPLKISCLSTAIMARIRKLDERFFVFWTMGIKSPLLKVRRV